MSNPISQPQALCEGRIYVVSELFFTTFCSQECQGGEACHCSFFCRLMLIFATVVLLPPSSSSWSPNPMLLGLLIRLLRPAESLLIPHQPRRSLSLQILLRSWLPMVGRPNVPIGTVQLFLIISAAHIVYQGLRCSALGCA